MVAGPMLLVLALALLSGVAQAYRVPSIIPSKARAPAAAARAAAAPLLGQRLSPSPRSLGRPASSTCCGARHGGCENHHHQQQPQPQPQLESRGRGFIRPLPARLLGKWRRGGRREGQGQEQEQEGEGKAVSVSKLAGGLVLAAIGPNPWDR